MHIVALGELLVDMFPAEIGRRLADVSAFYPKPGGAPANVAVAARRLGATTAFIGKVGEDAFGHHLIDVLQREGVETRAIRLDVQARTTMAVIALPDADTAEFVFYRNPGADQHLRVDELDVDLLRSARVLHIGSLSLTHEPSRSATLEAVRIAKAAGALISFDVNFRPSLWPSSGAALAQIESILPYIDLLKVNQAELELLGQVLIVEEPAQQVPELAITLLEHGPTIVVVTLGPQGSCFSCAAGGGFVPAFQVQTVDAIGCGDAFVAGVLVQLVRREEWREHLTTDRLHQVLRYASAGAALTATRQGVIPALPTASEVEQFLQERGYALAL